MSVRKDDIGFFELSIRKRNVKEIPDDDFNGAASINNNIWIYKPTRNNSLLYMVIINKAKKNIPKSGITNKDSKGYFTHATEILHNIVVILCSLIYWRSHIYVIEGETFLNYCLDVRLNEPHYCKKMSLMLVSIM